MKKLKIVVGMSGGVDSSVAALLLKQQGHEVIGLFMQNWDSALNGDVMGNPNLIEGINDAPCEVEKDYQDALEVAKKIGIQLHRVNFVKEYWENVFKYFIDEYKHARTPNPDIMCNKYIKFDYFLKYAIKKFNCDYIAMGHYAIVEHEKTSSFLYKGKDLTKDQTYFLCQLSQDKLSKSLFPIGHLLKSEVREIAEKNGLITFDKKDSTGICFIGERNFKLFLQNYIPAKPGKIIDTISKKEIGAHIGVMYYTIGQRKGLNLGGSSEKYFVSGRDVNNAILYVTPNSKERETLYSTSCTAADLNWINKRPEPGMYKAKFRYRQEDVDVEISFSNEDMVVTYLQGVKSVTSGQSVVIYEGDKCLGGGIVNSIFNGSQKILFQ